MWHDEVSHLTCWTKQSVGESNIGKERKRKEKKREKKRRRGRGFNFSLEFSAIGRSVSVKARRKVLLRDEGFA